MASDAITRLYDVDADSVKYVGGNLHFSAKKGQSIDVDKIYESFSATRLSVFGGRQPDGEGWGTGSGVTYLELTARGEVLERGKDLLLKVSGTGHELVLSEDPRAKGALLRLRQAVADGAKVNNVTGRVPGWTGHFPAVLKALAKDKGSWQRQLAVTDFELSK